MAKQQAMANKMEYLRSISKCPVSVIVLTYNEEANIAPCLESLRDFANEVFIVDSFSNDRTLEISGTYTTKIYQNPWVDWATQRNWALDHLPLSQEWVFFLDADERVTADFSSELKQSLAAAPPEIAGLNVHFKFFFLGRPLKFAYESPPVLRIVRQGRGRWGGEGAREYARLDGKALNINSKLDHWDQKGLAAWIAKQTGNASREVLLRQSRSAKVRREETVVSQGTCERPWRRWFRDQVWESLPLYWRTFPYFFYRLIIRGGILDGKAGFAYCFLHALWYPLLIDMMITEKHR